MTDKLLDKIRTTMGIDALNDMQSQMAQATEPKITLLAPTGSGKTLAFAIPLVRAIDTAKTDVVQALVIAPSRELVQQIQSVVRPLALPAKTVAIYGGHPFADEVKSLTPAPAIIIATPGRLVDHLRRDTVDISHVTTLILDEYDKSLQLGFHEQMSRIVKHIRHPRRIILTSATPLAEQPPFLDLTGMRTIDYSSPYDNAAPASNIDRILVQSHTPDKLQTLTTLLRKLPTLPDGTTPKTIIFVNHRDSAERVHTHLTKQNIPAGLYHGGLDQRQREIAIQLLNNATTPVLVSTDLGARGLDIDTVANVIHYHLPPSPEAWTHRNGRTGRQGAPGTIYTITSPKETLPPYVDTDTTLDPDTLPQHNIRSAMATIYFPAGRKEKLSTRDILGYLSNVAPDILLPTQVGKIYVTDHYSLAAVPRSIAQPLLPILKTTKIKARSIKPTLIY